MKSSGHAFGASRGSWLSIHYVTVIATLFGAVVVLNITDLWTSMTALGMGLTEGNGLVTWFAGSLGLSVVGGLAIIKIAAVLGGLAAAMLGIRFKDPVVRKTAIGVMIFLMAYLLVISINNIYQIYL